MHAQYRYFNTSCHTRQLQRLEGHTQQRPLTQYNFTVRSPWGIYLLKAYGPVDRTGLLRAFHQIKSYTSRIQYKTCKTKQGPHKRAYLLEFGGLRKKKSGEWAKSRKGSDRKSNRTRQKNKRYRKVGSNWKPRGFQTGGRHQKSPASWGNSLWLPTTPPPSHSPK